MRRVPTDPPSNDPRHGDTPPREPPSEEQTRRQGLAYQGAFEAVLAVPIATGIGYWADGRFDTSPYLLLLGAVLGFASFVWRLLRLGRQLHAPQAEENGPPNESSP